ncbi:sugar isomerase (SIS) [Aureimonas endophytica]|uniref:Sugar isomerase (SIS) n=1 Tax=Aureimonas endophytica TaxID=2027858 RepID=A0A917E9E3_9HYPH|nr:MurR/RpiR family transcriptional regulator [Aureimonas endophytica]GGE16046.1 sugar isomerase (SIS) [Aureimonas endophytica]
MTDGTEVMDLDAAPETYAELRDRLASGHVRLSKRLKQVASFALAQPDEVALGTVASIAEKAEVQPSTLIRFSQALGFAGFSDLQTLFRERLRNQVSNYDERLLSLRAKNGDASRSAVLFDGFCEAATRSITAAHDRIDLGAVDEAARILAKAETIYLIAQRRSFPVTSYMSYALGKLGIRNVLIGSALGTDAETVSFATPRDAALAISFTPYASSTVAFARQVAELGTPLVVITDSPFSPLVGEGRLWFEVVEADFQGFRSLAASLSLAMTLVVALADLRREMAPPRAPKEDDG